VRILIVARTRMRGERRCIGALTLGPETESLRLRLPDGSYPSVASPYQVGQIWDVKYTRSNISRRPPHTEDVLVLRARPMGVDPNPTRTILARVRPWRGGIEQLFGGHVRFTANGNGYISERGGVPNFSTGFWVPDRDLILRDDGTHFDYLGVVRRGLAYVGEREPPPRIRAGTLVRVSLATWWRPENAEDVEERCYLQLSHWYD